MPKNNDFLATARERFRKDIDDEKEIREQALIDLEFVAGEQWDEKVKQDRIKGNRPVLTFSRCHTFVQQVANEARESRGEIKFVPAEDGDKETAEVYEGLARHIQYNSKAKVAYETAVDYSAGGSFGFYRFLTEYCDDDSFNQDIVVKPVFDPFSVYGVLIPSCFGQEPDHAFVVETLTKEEYKQQFPENEVKDWETAQQEYSDWIREDSITIAEYWTVEKTEKTIHQLEDGSVVEGKLAEGVKPAKSRTVSEKHIKFCKTNGIEILKDSETEWPGKRIPIFAVLGKGMIVRGKPKLFSVVRFQRDPQRLINFYKTRIAETLGTAPIQPYMVAEGQIEGHEAEWAKLNSSMAPYLTYNPTTIGGVTIGAPQRQIFEPPVMALSQAAAQEIDDMKATSGIYDASLGNKSNESSGIALARRQQQADITNLHFMDNLARSFDESGTELANVIPIIYDTPRAIRILGDDEAPKIVKINQAFDDGGRKKQFIIGGEGAGKYDVLVTMGRSFSSKRLESFDMIGQVVQGNPQVFPMIADVFFKNSDIAGADQLAERFKMMLPPNVQQAEQKDKAMQLPPQVQQQMAQMGQMIEALTGQLNEAQNAIETRKPEIESRERIEMARLQHQSDLEVMRLQTQVALKSAELESKESTDIFKAEVDVAKQGMNLDAQAAARESEAAASEMGANNGL